MIEPTVGRKVWFTPAKTDTAMIQRGQPLDATVVYVHNDRLVNLVVFDATGHLYREQSVTMLQDGDERPDDGRYCEWMPYQKGQAAKA